MLFIVRELPADKRSLGDHLTHDLTYLGGIEPVAYIIIILISPGIFVYSAMQHLNTESYIFCAVLCSIPTLARPPSSLDTRLTQAPPQ